MKNIWRVYMSDLKRLTTNVVALSIVMGLCIIPSLYAWFNIMSNWDPYGESATSLMKISVYSEDEGMDMSGMQLTIGDMVTESLENNNTIDWTFTDSKSEALELIASGDCYAGIVIPKDFTKNMLSILSGNIVNPDIEYYENSKKNAIATKITGKVKTTVQNEINTKLISTLTEIFANAGDYLSGNNIDGADMIAGFESRLNQVSSTLDNYIYMMNTFKLLTESSSDAIDTTKLLLPGIDSMASSGAKSLGNLGDSAKISSNVAATGISLLNTGLDTITDKLDALKNTVNSINRENSLAPITDESDITILLSNNVLDTIADLLESKSPTVSEAKNQFEKLKSDIEQLTNDANLTDADITSAKSSILSDISKCQDYISEVKSSINDELAPKLEGSLNNISASLSQAQTILSGVPGNFSDISKNLTEYQNILKSGTSDIENTIKCLKDLQSSIDKIITDIHDITSSGKYQEFINAIKDNPQIIVDFISSPVQMNTVAVYEISNYGSAMAPFYTVLALWVGALILVALIHVKVKDNKELEGVKPYQKFFGRYLNFFVIGQVQTIITVFGDLFYVGIQCKHPIAFTLAAMMTSFVFTFLIYSLTVAFGNIGEAIAVVIMVIQVAGAGGTFPVEVLPSVYQYLYKFMPFSYCMNALRECVAGMYQNTYGRCLATLLIYVAISAVIGLLFAKPCTKLLDKLEHSKEKSGLFI